MKKACPQPKVRWNGQKALLKKSGLKVSEKTAEVGEPVWRIIEKGRDYSLIVISATEKSKTQTDVSGQHLPLHFEKGQKFGYDHSLMLSLPFRT